jgi:hypothetical protein
MSSLLDLIHEHYDPEPDVTVAAVFAAAHVPEKWQTFFYAVVRDECRRQSRRVVRLHERGLTDEELSPTGTMSEPTATMTPSPWVNVNARTVYLADRMCINSDGVYVLKGEATADEWMQRAAYLSTFRDGLNATIDDCVAVAKYLIDVDLECLNDLQEDAA